MGKKGKRLKAAQIIAMGFAALILIGALLLMLPIASSDGSATSFVDALFTSATSVCVTGLVVRPTFAAWSLFGKVIILILIQLGGMGVIACSTLVFIIMGRKITLKSRRLIQETYNLDHLDGMVRMVRNIVIGTLTVEGIGAVAYSIQFIPEYGIGGGIWRAVFTSVSAFCNAGIDILGNDSLAPYVTNPLVNITTMVLIVMGGIGFTVWWDVHRVSRGIRQREYKPGAFFSRLELHSKLALSVTLFLLITGTLLILLFDWGNQSSLGSLSSGNRVMAALFQSVTTRTAGFQTIPQQGFSNATNLVSIILMFIGGSPMGTAGGMKTTTVAMIVLTALCFIEGKRQTTIFKRRIKTQNIRTALAILFLGITVVFAALISLCALMPKIPIIDILFETTSAIGTVGLSRGLTFQLTTPAKYIITLVMYIGRIGPITLASAVAVRSRMQAVSVEMPEQNVIIG